MIKYISLLFILLSNLLFAQKTYNFVSIEKLIEQEIGREILPKIYEKLNTQITITPHPAKRAQAYAVSGIKDGEIMRIWSYGEENPTTLRVPTPYYKLETMAFIKKDSGILIKSKKDLKKYKITKVRGVKHTDKITKGLNNVHDSRNTDVMMRFLNAGRADVALTNTVDGLIVLKKLGFDNIVSIESPLAVLDLYHYIHEKNKNLIPKVDNIILKMKKSGELNKIITEAESKVIGQ